MKLICKVSPVICFTFIFGYFSPFNSLAQKSDTTDIEQTIEKYIAGWRTANADLLKEAFDLDAGIVLWVDNSGESEQLKSMELSELTNRNKPIDDYGIGYKIQSLQIIDTRLAIAFVKIPLKSSYYIDCLELQKINSQWKIVLKSFVYFQK